MNESVHDLPGGAKRKRSRDAPERDPNVLAVEFDVTALSVGELERAGVRLDPAVVDVTPASEAWASHSQYAAMNPAHDATDRGYARVAARRHVDLLCRNVVECPACGAAAGSPCRGLDGALSMGAVHPARRLAGRDAGAATLRGLRLRRSFPCLGTLRMVEWHGPLRVVQCDRCGASLGVRGRPPEPEAAAKPEPARPDDTEPFGAFT